MAEFEFRKHPTTKKWVVMAPRRSKRTNVGGKTVAICPFCIGQEKLDNEVYRVGGKEYDTNWEVRVVPNKFPFTPHHEVIIHSPDHHKSFDELPFSQIELILKTYRQCFNIHKKEGQVYIFHNHGHASGESLPHPHTQLTVVPKNVYLDIPPLDLRIYNKNSKEATEVLETDQFLIDCPYTCDWPDEVWIAPREKGKTFGETTDHQITDLAFALSRLIQLFDLRHGYEFPYNFYIYPGKNWYLRLIPRLKTLGGFELGTNIIVNTQDPKETMAFIKEHFWQPDKEKIKSTQSAEYLKSV